MFIYLFKKLPVVKKHKLSLLSSQKSALGACPMLHILTTYFLNIHFNIILIFFVWSSKVPIFNRFVNNFIHISCFPYLSSVCTAHLTTVL